VHAGMRTFRATRDDLTRGELVRVSRKLRP
jgi:hypothetical protein